MNDRPSARTGARRAWPTVLASLVLTVGAAATGAHNDRPPSAPAASASFTAAPLLAPGHPRDSASAVGRDDGVVSGRTTVFDGRAPAVTRLDAALLRALRRAAMAAADDGVTILVTSGWRSPKYQNQLLREAITKYGSNQLAARWVATADTSPHVSGQAVDVGPVKAQSWLATYGATYGLCQIYRNEPWHYERRSTAPMTGCPPMYADPAHDPRLQ